MIMPTKMRFFFSENKRLSGILDPGSSNESFSFAGKIRRLLWIRFRSAGNKAAGCSAADS